MIVRSETGMTPEPEIPEKPWYEFYREFLGQGLLFAPLWCEIHKVVLSHVAKGGVVEIDSRKEGNDILRNLGGTWKGEYEEWMYELCRRKPDLVTNNKNESPDSASMYGMALWNYLARRHDRWKVTYDPTTRYQLRP